MRIPFVHRTALGVAFSEGAVHWAVVEAGPRRLRVVGCGEAPFEGGDLEDALRALPARLRGRGAVATALAPGQTRHLAPAPYHPEEGEPLEEWATGRVQRALPRGVGSEGFAVRPHLTSDGRGGAVGTVTYARRAAVAERAAAFADAGFPLTLLTSPAAAALALTWDDRFATGPAAVLVLDARDPFLCTCDWGGVSAVYGLVPGPPGALLEEAEGHLLMAESSGVPRQGAVWLLGADGPTAAAATERFGPDRRVHVAHPPCPSAGAAEEAHPVNEPAAALALGLAVAALVPSLSPPNLLDPDAAQEALGGEAKREALRAVLASAATLLVLLVLLSVAEAAAGWGRQQAEGRLMELAGETAAVRHARADVERLRMGAARVERRAEGVPLVRLLDDIGRAVPQGLWLYGLEVTADTTTVVELRGLAVDEFELAAFLSSLEGGLLADADLVRSEVLRPEDVLVRSRGLALPLRAFEVRAGLPSAGPARPRLR